MSDSSGNFVIVDEESTMVEPAKEDLILDMQKKRLTEKLKCTSAYIDIYMKQVIFEQNSQKNINLDSAFPFPMFEYRVKYDSWCLREQTNIIKKGMSLNFHVLYAEMEILKMLITG